MFGALLAKLAAVEGKARAFFAAIDGQITTLEREVQTIDADVLALFTRVQQKTQKARGEVDQRIGAAIAAVKRLSPPA